MAEDPNSSEVKMRPPQPSEPSVSVPFMGRIRIKYIALLLLVAQTVGAIVFMRVSRLTTDSSGLKYLNTTAVVMSEVLKLVGSVLLVWKDNDFSASAVIHEIDTTIIKNPIETLKVGVPAFLYTVQNNLIFIALSNMSPALYQVTYQLKILTTAILSVLMLSRRLSVGRWLSLLILTIGVALIQVPTGGKTVPVEGNLFIGMVAVISACFTSGFAGVYFEKILKGSNVSIWLRNIQLAVFGIVMGMIGVWWNDGDAIASNGFFQGYTGMTWTVVLLQSAGGLIVAAVLKYADNILKCFGNAVAIVLSCLVSYWWLNELSLSFFFFIGTAFVVFSTYAYGVDLAISNFIPKDVISTFLPKKFDEEAARLKTSEMTSSNARSSNEDGGGSVSVFLKQDP